MGRQREFDEADVVQKAMQAFWKDGWRETTPQRLVEATGLSRSSLYRTFGSKQGLFLAALDLYVEEQEVAMEQMLAEGTIREALERMYEMMAQMLRPGGPGATCLVAGALLEIPAEDEETLARVASGHARLRAVFETRFQRAIDEGDLDGSPSASELARFVATVNDGIQVAARAQASEDELRRIGRMAVDTVC